MKPANKESQRHIDAVLKALDVLDCFLQKPYFRIKDLMDVTGLTRSRLMRLTGTLMSREYLVKEPDSDRFVLGPRIYALGKIYERENSLVSLSRPILKRLAQETGESASLYVIDGLKRMVLVREEGTQDIRYQMNEGQYMELHAGAGGKILLAYGPEEVRSNVLANTTLSRLTDKTLAEPERLRAELEKIRSKGYAISLGERVIDSGAIAAPVFDHENRFVAALGIAGPASRFESLDMDDKYLSRVLAAAKELSHHLGWAESTSEKNRSEGRENA